MINDTQNMSHNLFFKTMLHVLFHEKFVILNAKICAVFQPCKSWKKHLNELANCNDQLVSSALKKSLVVKAK